MESDSTALNNNTPKVTIVSSRRSSRAMSKKKSVCLDTPDGEEERGVCGLSKSIWSGVKVTILWIAYVLFGALVFMYMEKKEEEVQLTTTNKVWARFKEVAHGREGVQEALVLRSLLLDICDHSIINETFGQLEKHVESEHPTDELLIQRVGLDKNASAEVWARVEDECGEALKIVKHITKTNEWSLVDSIYYTMTAVTTIGYGHIYPSSDEGRLFCVLYCLVGVPLTCILLAKSSDMLSNRMVEILQIVQSKHRRQRKLILYGITWIYLIVGFIVFMFLPSIVISKLEGWTYNETLYVTFITLTTIGFGEYYPGYKEGLAYPNLYKMCLIIWIMVALGYWFMLLNFLQKALRQNVPRRIKRLRRSRTVAKQSKFFRQMVSKALSQREGDGKRRVSGVLTAEEGAEGQVAALVEEVADALGSRRQSRARPSIGGLEGQEAESVPPITLAQLLNLNICLKSCAVPTVRSAVAQSPKEHELTRTFSDLFNEPGEDEEVVLPLKDVLNLVDLIKSVEQEVIEGNGSSTSSHDDSSSLLSSPMSTVTSLDNRDFVPLLGAKNTTKLMQQNSDETEIEGELSGDEESDYDMEGDEEMEMEEGRGKCRR